MRAVDSCRRTRYLAMSPSQLLTIEIESLNPGIICEVQENELGLTILVKNSYLDEFTLPKFYAFRVTHLAIYDSPIKLIRNFHYYRLDKLEVRYSKIRNLSLLLRTMSSLKELCLTGFY